MSKGDNTQFERDSQTPPIDKTALLHKLNIDQATREQTRKMPLVLLSLLVLVAVAGGGWAWYGGAAQPLALDTYTVSAASAGVPANTVLNASGYVTARLQATVSSKVTGKVVEVYIEEGDFVAEGQILARLDSGLLNAQLRLGEAQLAAAESVILELDVRLREAQLNLNRTARLTEKSLASKAELDAATLAVEAYQARIARSQREVEVSARRLEVQKQQLTDTEIRAPFAGIVINKSAQPGEMISPISGGGGFTRTGIGTLVDMKSLEIEVDVNESNINRVTPGQSVTAVLNSYQDWEIPAEVITIIPTADRNKATVRVRIKFLETDDRILPDMGVKVSFLEELEAPASGDAQVAGVLVPQAAIYASGNRNFVLTVHGTELEQRQVTLGSTRGTNRLVVGGLVSGEIVIARVTSETAQEYLSAGPEIVINN